MDEGVLIPLTAIMLPVVLVPTVLTLKYRQRKREWLHQERLRALEMGMPTADLEPRLGAGSVMAIGAGVPAATVTAAFLTTTQIPHDHPEYLPVLAVTWGCALMISSGAFVTSLILGLVMLRSRRNAGSAEGFETAKPMMDPDAYDVVSMRG